MAHPLPTRLVAAGAASLLGGRLRRITDDGSAASERHIEFDHPGELVGFDCFHVGRLSVMSGKVWKDTAIDLATADVWAELHMTPPTPSTRNTSRLA